MMTKTTKTTKTWPPELTLHKLLLVEKDNRGLNIEILPTGATPVVGDAFQILKTDDSGEYAEYVIVNRLFREVPNTPPGVAAFDLVCVVIQRPVQWQP